MPNLAAISAALRGAIQWLRRTPGIAAFTVVASCAMILVKLAQSYHNKFEKWEAVWEDPPKPTWLAWYETLHPYLGLIVLFGFIVFMVHALRVYPDLRRLVRPLLALGATAAVWIMLRECRDKWWGDRYGLMGEPPTFWYFLLKQLLLLFLLLSPAGALAWYTKQKMLQKYTLQAFVQPLAFCYTAFALLWVLIDLMDKMRDYQDAGTRLGTIVWLYIGMLPAVYVMVTPAAMLLAGLYALTKLSRANEIVSMLTSGMSLFQILRPVLLVAAYASMVGMALNFHWAPRADADRLEALRNNDGKERKSGSANAAMYRNEETGRTWYVGKVPLDQLREKMQRINIYQLDGKGHIKTAWRANTAKWWAPDRSKGQTTGMWSLYYGTERNYRGSVQTDEKFFDGRVDDVTRLDITDWPETPWRIISDSLAPDTLGVTELAAYLSANADLPKDKLAPFRTHFYHRFAQPWQGFMVMLMAAPLGVAFSRRGAVGGMALAVIAFFGLMFVNEFCLSMGKGHHLSAWLAAWLPNFLAGGVGPHFCTSRRRIKTCPELILLAGCRRPSRRGSSGALLAHQRGREELVHRSLSVQNALERLGEVECGLHRQHDGVPPAAHVFGDFDEAPSIVLLEVQEEDLPVGHDLLRV